MGSFHIKILLYGAIISNSSLFLNSFRNSMNTLIRGKAKFQVFDYHHFQLINWRKFSCATTSIRASVTGEDLRNNVEYPTLNEDLENMKLNDLKILLRKLGGKPGNLKKSEIYELCKEIVSNETAAEDRMSPIAAAYVNDSFSQLFISNPGEPTDRQFIPNTRRIRSLPPFPASIDINNLNNQTESNPPPLNTDTSGANESLNSFRGRPQVLHSFNDKNYLFPTGEHRNQRLGGTTTQGI